MITTEELHEWARAELDEIAGLLARESTAAHETAGRCYRALGEEKRAAHHLCIAFDEMGAHDPGAYKVRGGLYRLLGEPEHAREQFRRALERHAERGWTEQAHGRAVWLYFMLGEHEAVLAHHEQCGKPLAGVATPWIAMLSRARLEDDPEPAAEALAWLERQLRRERGRIGIAPAPATPWVAALSDGDARTVPGAPLGLAAISRPSAGSCSTATSTAASSRWPDAALAAAPDWTTTDAVEGFGPDWALLTDVPVDEPLVVWAR